MPPLLPFSLDALRSHAIFVPPASSSTDDGWELVDPQPSLDGLPAAKNERIAVRDRDLLVAFGKEIRMTSLAGEGWEIRGSSVGGYKVGSWAGLGKLTTDAQIAPSHIRYSPDRAQPHGTLTGCCGTPPARRARPPSRRVCQLCRWRGCVPVRRRVSLRSAPLTHSSFPVDEYQHSPSSLTALTKVRWHPWGEGGNSLWALAANGKL